LVLGVSGGEEGALLGLQSCLEDKKEAYDLVAPILEKIAAVAEDGQPCVAYIGPNGAGHLCPRWCIMESSMATCINCRILWLIA